MVERGGLETSVSGENLFEGSPWRALEKFLVEVRWKPAESEFAFNSARVPSSSLNSDDARTRLGCDELKSPEALVEGPIQSILATIPVMS